MMAASLRGRRVLVLEDEYWIAVEMQEAFEAAGAEVVGPVSTVANALALLDEAPVLDGAVLDINLHGEMSYAVADALAARGVPFVFATGYDAGHIPGRHAKIVRCEKPVAPQGIAQALFG